MRKLLLLFFCMLSLTSCTYNPFTSNNHTTGTVTGVVAGAVLGAGGAALLQLSRPVIFLAGVGGGALGYYASTLRFAASGIVLGGGKVYVIGDYVGIDIPSDNLFDPNTSDFKASAYPILQSIVVVLMRYPNNHVMISGNTSGFGFPRWERALSKERAQKIAAYLWHAEWEKSKQTIRPRPFAYVGEGDHFPIANDYTNEGIRANSRIQIASYPPHCPPTNAKVKCQPAHCRPIPAGCG